MFVTLVVRYTCGIVHKGSIDNDGGVLGLENQELCSSEISDDDIIFGLDFTALDVQSL